MINRNQVRMAQQKAAAMLAGAGIVVTPQEAEQIEVTEFGLGDLEQTGLELIVYMR